jgi:hypothetical protein
VARLFQENPIPNQDNPIIDGKTRTAGRTTG